MVIDNVVSSVKNIVKKAAVPIVAGYSAFFTTLDRAVQEDIITGTEHAL